MTTATLPALTGTPKQIAWAEDIRATILDAFEQDRLRLPSPERAVEILRTALERITDSCEWIDLRDVPWNVIVKDHLTPEETAEMHALHVAAQAERAAQAGS